MCRQGQLCSTAIYELNCILTHTFFLEPKLQQSVHIVRDLTFLASRPLIPQPTVVVGLAWPRPGLGMPWPPLWPLGCIVACPVAHMGQEYTGQASVDPSRASWLKDIDTVYLYFITVKVHNPFVFAEQLHPGHNLFLFFCPKASVTGQ